MLISRRAVDPVSEALAAQKAGAPRPVSFCGRSGRGLNLPLQLQQVAPQSIPHLHAQVREFEELLAKLALPPEKIGGGEGCGDDEQPEHYEYELHYWHSPVCT